MKKSAPPQSTAIPLPQDLEQLKAEVETALGEVRPAGSPNSHDEPRGLMLSSRTDGGRELPPYFLVYFVLVDLLGFFHMGQWEKTAWCVPIRFRGQLYAIEHRKMGLGIFAPTLDPQARMSAPPSHQAEADAVEICKLVKGAVKAAAPYFEWRALQAASTSQLNVTNKSSELFERYEHFRDESQRLAAASEEGMKKCREENEESSPFDPPSHRSIDQWLVARRASEEAKWNAQAAIEAYFSWTEHAFIHIAILQSRLRVGTEVAELAGAEWKTKFKAALDISDNETKGHYDRLLDIRAQLRNFLAHGAFGKKGEAFHFHSGAGAVPLLLTDDLRRRYVLTSGPAFDETYALQEIEKFTAHLWTGARLPARKYIFSHLPAILSLATDGTYRKSMRSEVAMDRLVKRLTSSFDDARNMDW
jgi:hypothetical protein